MKSQRGSSVLLLSVLLTSVILLAWSVLSTWRQDAASSSAQTTTAAVSGDTLPPPLNSKGAKASLFYPVLKARGPQPGGSVVSKPLIVSHSEPSAQ